MQKDQTHAPREWFERLYNVQHWTELPRGGHFPNWEEPGLDAQEMRTFLRQ
jgi:microsomal epoxide hydrolase